MMDVDGDVSMDGLGDALARATAKLVAFGSGSGSNGRSGRSLTERLTSTGGSAAAAAGAGGSIASRSINADAPQKQQSQSQSQSRTATVHRVRFVDWAPSNITSMQLTPLTWDPSTAYPHAASAASSSFSSASASASTSAAAATSSSSSSSSSRQQPREVLAIGRQNGDIEIYVWIGGEGRMARNAERRHKLKMVDKAVGRGATVKQAEAEAKRFAHSLDKSAGNRQGWVLQKTLAAPFPSRVEHLLFTHQAILSAQDLELLDQGEEQERELRKLRRTPPRLFSAGGGSDLWEWDWQDGSSGRVKRTLSSQGGAIWSMAVNPAHTKIALGCDDGAVRIVSILDGELQHVRKFDSTKSRLLSIAWGPMERMSRTKNRLKQAAAAVNGNHNGDDAAGSSDDDDDDDSATTTWEDAFIVTGCADSTVRKWNARTGRCEYRMTTDKVKGEQTLVWASAVLADGTIVTGDSMGNVKFWDPVMGTQINSVKAHKADVLCLTLGPDGKTVYSSGVDQKVAQMQCVNVQAKRVWGSSATQETEARWMLTHTRRLHAHDVRALVVSPSHVLPSPTHPTPRSSSPIPNIVVPIIISGGLDFAPVLTPAATEATVRAATASGILKLTNPVTEGDTASFQDGQHRKWQYVPQRSLPVSLAAEGKVIALRRERSIDLWRLQGAAADGQNWVKVLEMDLNVKTNLVAAAVSPDGRWLAASDAVETKVFKLKRSADGLYKAKRSQAVSVALASHVHLQDDQGSSVLVFTHDSTRLVLGTASGSRIAVLSLPASSSGGAEVMRIFSQHRQQSSVSRLGRSIAAAPSYSSKARVGLVNGTNRDASAESSGSESDDGSDGNREEEPSTAQTGNNAKHPSIAAMATSLDGQWLVSVDHACGTHIFNLDALQYHSALPSVEQPPVSLAFSPTNASLLVIGLPNNNVHFFDVESRQIPPWARKFSQRPNTALSGERDPLLGVSFDPRPQSGGRDTVVLYGASWLAKLSVPSGRVSQAQKPRRQATTGVRPKRKRTDANDSDETGAEDQDAEDSDDDEEESAIQSAELSRKLGGTHIEVTHKYNPILFSDFTADGELVVVERPYFGLLGQMAPAFAETRYGQ